MTGYYQRVADYFDQDAAEFEARYWANPILQRIRQAFREEVKRHRFGTALEIGCGTGLDLCHFGRIFPERRFFGVDVAPNMVRLARANVAERGLGNVTVALGSVEQVAECFPGRRFDLVYVFFGALNTVPCLRQAAGVLCEATAPGGVLVISVVNRWHAAEVALDLLRGRMRRAWQRTGTTWGGYSPARRLHSHWYSWRDVAAAFRERATLVRSRGFSIAYPPWYRSHRLSRMGRLGRWLWEVDALLNWTPLRTLGEYALYVYRRVPAGPVIPAAQASAAVARVAATQTASPTSP